MNAAIKYINIDPIKTTESALSINFAHGNIKLIKIVTKYPSDGFNDLSLMLLTGSLLTANLTIRAHNSISATEMKSK